MDRRTAARATKRSRGALRSLVLPAAFLLAACSATQPAPKQPRDPSAAAQAASRVIRLHEHGVRSVAEIHYLSAGLFPSPHGYRLEIYRVVGRGEARAGATPRVAAPERRRCSPHPSSRPVVDDSPQPSLQATGKPSKGLWVWGTGGLLGDTSEIDRLRRFCRDQGVDTVFLHVPYTARQRVDRSWEVSWSPQRMRTLVSALHSAGISAEALLGTPQLALPAYHGQIIAVVEALVRNNRATSPESRFAALHLDVEPYLLPDRPDADRADLYQQYLTLLRKLQRVTAAAGLPLNVDIPFWFDTVCLPIDVAADRWRPLSELVIDVADRITVMAYRTALEGANGLIALSQHELHYAALRGRPLMIGLETTPLPDGTRGDFSAEGRGRLLLVEQLDRDTARVTWPLSEQRALRDASRTSARYQLLRQIAERPIPASRITFARLGPSAFSALMQQAAARLQHYPSFAGFAIHDYQGVRRWAQGDGPF